MTDRMWAAAGIFAVFLAVLYTAGWQWLGWPRPPWLPRWRCGDGFWHWRKECDGHGGLDVDWQIDPPLGDDGRAIMLPRLGASFGGTLFIDKETGEGHWEHWHKDAPEDAEAALDEAWVAELHGINADLHQPAPDILGLDRETWIDQWRADHWDYDKWLDAVHVAEIAKFNAGWKAYRLGCGLEWRDDMGLAA